MRKLSLVDYGKLELEEGLPSLGKADEKTVKVRVKACAICGSDIALYKGQRSLKDERYFGHEFAGIVEDEGSGAHGLKTGMRVASELSYTCGRCQNCLNGLKNYCRSMNEALLPGGFSEETLVLNTDDYSFLSPIEDDLSFETASLLEPVNCACRIASQAGLRSMDNVVIYGLGAMGLFAALLLKAAGAQNIVGVDRSQERLKAVKALNILETVDGGDEHCIDKIKALTSSYGADIVIEATGAVSVLQSAFAAVRPGGRIVVGSVYHQSAGDLLLLPIMRKEITIVGAKGPYPSLTSQGRSIPQLSLHRLRHEMEKLISVYDFKDARQAFADAMSGKAVKAVVRFD